MTQQTARENLASRLAGNSYPGRGLIVGQNDRGRWVQVYWIMGRSANSRNRLFVLEGDTLRTEAADPSRVEDPSLIIYNAMRRLDQWFIVTNGAQTDALYAALARGGSFVDALGDWSYEPDAPNYTPRISAMLDYRTGETWMAVIRSGPQPGGAAEQHFFRYRQMPAGAGYAVTTYKHDGTPLPAFEGAPYLLPLEGDAARIATRYWEVLDAGNRISLAVREIDPATGASRTEMRNRNAPHAA